MIFFFLLFLRFNRKHERICTGKRETQWALDHTCSSRYATSDIIIYYLASSRGARLVSVLFHEKCFHFQLSMDFIVWHSKKNEKSHCYSRSAYYIFRHFFYWMMKKHFQSSTLDRHANESGPSSNLVSSVSKDRNHLKNPVPNQNRFRLGTC